MKKLRERASHEPKLKFAELFAGVGGFRVGLERAKGYEAVWSNQWEPSTLKQHASEVYRSRLGSENHVCEDIKKVLDEFEAEKSDIPDFDLLVGGFPCQDYSVAKTLSQAVGIVGKKGVLWWEIHRLLRTKRPNHVLLENVDRLLQSPSTQRGRDFAIILATLCELGYQVEWRTINAADYGLPQKRRRVFIYASKIGATQELPIEQIFTNSVLSKAFPIIPSPPPLLKDSNVTLKGNLSHISAIFGKESQHSVFKNAGFMKAGFVWTREVRPLYKGPRQILRDVLQADSEVPNCFYVSDSELDTWKYLKGAKNEKRVSKATGFEYFYSEGAIPFPDDINQPSRTILTGEGGSSPSRFKHLIQTKNGKFRRLTPIELEKLNGFEEDWTKIEGISDGRRAFLMGNALVVGLVERIGRALKADYISNTVRSD